MTENTDTQNITKRLNRTIQQDNQPSIKVKINILYIKINKQSKSQIDLVIEEQIKKNKYDYKRMLYDFEIETRIKKIYNGIKNKWEEINKSYLEKIEEMKLKNEKIYKERDRKFKLKIKNKELSIKKQIKLKNEKLLQKKKEQEEITKKKSDDVLKNLQEFNKKQEEKRLKLEQNTFLKSIYI